MQLLAANHMFRGSAKDIDPFNNDVWVWTKEQQGIDLNAAVIFLPEKTAVDRQTGSRYQLDTDQSPIINQELVDAVQNRLDQAEIKTLLKTGSEEMRNFGYLKSGTLHQLSIGLGGEDQDLVWKLRLILPDIIHHLAATLPEEDAPNTAAEYLIKRISLYYIESQDTVPAQSYWEEYFRAHPEQRPSKIVYYVGTPTEAVKNWLDQYGVKGEYDTSQPEVASLFEEHRAHNQPDHPDITYGQKEFYELGIEIIERFAPEEGVGAEE